MKKKILSIFALVFCVALIFTGCATVSGVKGKDGKSIYFDEAVHFGGHIAEVGDYIYYGNGYVATSDSGFNYGDASKIAYLSRIKNQENFTFVEGTTEVNKPHTSPEEVEMVNGDKLVGFENQDMYALGEYLYFTSANTHKTSDMKNDYTQISLFRVKFDGDGFEEIATFKNDDKSTIELVKGSDNKYYFVAVAPADEGHAIYSVRVGDGVGKVTTLAENVTSAVVADKNSSEKNVIYTVDAEKEFATTSIKAIDFATGEEKTLDNGVAGSTTTLIDREGDVVFYSYTNPDNKVEEVYYKTINETSTNFSPVNRFYNAKTISDVQTAGDGYIFKTAGKALVYKTLDGTQELLYTTDEYSDVLFIEGEYVYTSTTSSISRVNLNTFEVDNIISDLTIKSGAAGYADGYIFFYAQLGEVETDEPEQEGEEEEEAEEEKDENYYMYRADLSGNIQLIGKTVKK